MMDSGRRAELAESARLYLPVLLACLVCSVCTYYLAIELELDKADSPQYKIMARNLVEHGVLSLEQHEADKPFYPTIARMPGFPAALACVRMLFGPSEWNYAFFNLACYTATCLLVTRFAQKEFGFYPALIAGLLCATHVQSLFHAMTVESEISTNLLIICLFYAYQRFREDGRSWPWMVIGCISGVISMYREPVLVILILGVLAWGTSWKDGVWYNAKRFALAGACVAAAYSPWVIRNYMISKEFIPITIFGKGAGVSQFHNKESGMAQMKLSDDIWSRLHENQHYVLDMICQDVGYSYYVIYPHFDNKPLQERKYELYLLDYRPYYPTEYAKKVIADDSIPPTVKIELIYTRFSKAAQKAIQTPMSLVQRLKRYILKTILFYSAGDTSPYTSWRYGYYSHKLVQVRWYLVEIPLILVGILVALKRRHYSPGLLFAVLNTIVVVLLMHIELRYALLPGLFLKIFAGLGAWSLIEIIRDKYHAANRDEFARLRASR